MKNMGDTEAGVLVPPTSDGSDGLKRYALALAAPCKKLVQLLYQQLEQDPEARPILQRLSEAERLHLDTAQEQHLLRLLQADLSKAEQRETARRIGYIHAMVGVSASTMVRTMGIYQSQLTSFVLALPAPLVDRSILLQEIAQRLQNNQQWQIERMDEHAQLLDHIERRVDVLCQQLQPWADTIRGLLDNLLEIPGAGGGAFLRLRDGVPVAEYDAGIFSTFWGTLHKTKSVTLPQGAQTAWGRDVMTHFVNFALYPDPALQQAATTQKIRSAVFLPLRDATGQTAALLCLLGEFPGLFESVALQRLLHSIIFQVQSALNRAAPIASQAPVQAEEHQLYRKLLLGNGLVMVYQPIIRLQDGLPVKVEALARLRMPNGSLLNPSQFLPWFGEMELAETFQRGLSQGLEQLVQWDKEGLSLKLNLNLPPEVFIMPACTTWVREALLKTGISPKRLHLELLENDAPMDPLRRDHAIAMLNALGVHLDMDDLGAGYSSLYRLHTLPFATIKIDQSLMRGCLQGSRKALGIVHGIVGMGRDLQMTVVIEGLENRGLLELALVMGAHYGQGYEIARPMLAEEIHAWVKNWHYEIDLAHPRNTLGVWARFWLWEHRRNQNSPPELSSCGIDQLASHPDQPNILLTKAHQKLYMAMTDNDIPATDLAIAQIETSLRLRIIQENLPSRSLA